MARPSINRLVPVPLEGWPLQDRLAWECAIAPGDVLDEGGHLSVMPLQPRHRVETEYGRWLAHLSLTMPAKTIRSGLDHLDAEHLREYVAYRAKGLVPFSIAALLKRLHAAARALDPARSWPVLAHAIRRYSHTAQPSMDKRARLRPIQDLYQLGLDLMVEATPVGSSIERASKYLDGLAIAALAACPVRIGNLGAMRLGRHVVKNADRYELSFAGDEVKNGRAIEFVLPADLTEPIDLYLASIRPLLLGGRGRWWRPDSKDAFWISAHGSPLSPKHLSVRVVQRTQETFNVGVNPHAFRAAAATAIAIHDPEHVGIIKSVLSHGAICTGERYYNMAASIDASRHYLDIIESLREGNGRN